ncbi:FAS-associated death domain protein [Aegotheles albertisi]
MDPFRALLHSCSASLTDSELASLKFLCRGKIGKRKLESVQSGDDLFDCLLEQGLIASDRVSFLRDLLKGINREDLVAQLQQFVDEGEVKAPDEQPDAHERRLLKAAIEIICDNVGKEWRRLIRKLDVSDVKIDRIVEANPRNVHEQFIQCLREWQKWKGRDAKVTDLVQALRDCHLNLVADIVERDLNLNTGTSVQAFRPGSCAVRSYTEIKLDHCHQRYERNLTGIFCGYAGEVTPRWSCAGYMVAPLPHRARQEEPSSPTPSLRQHTNLCIVVEMACYTPSTAVLYETHTAVSSSIRFTHHKALSCTILLVKTFTSQLCEQ